MAKWQHHVFDALANMTSFLNGILIGSVNLVSGADVDGKTMIINVGGAGDRTVSFTPAKSRNWTLPEIIAKIESTHADLVGIAKNLVQSAIGSASVRLLAFEKAGAEIIIRGNGTANAELGFTEGATPANDTTTDDIATSEVMRIEHVITDSIQQWVVVTYR